MGQKAPLRPPKRRGKQTAKTSLAKQMAEIHALRRMVIAVEAHVSGRNELLWSRRHLFRN
jgi:hypothetical protein